VIHTLLGHVEEPADVLTEAFRVLKSNGLLGVCDVYFSTMSVSITNNDPLNSCVEAFKGNFVNDKWIARKLIKLVSENGFNVNPIRVNENVETDSAEMSMNWIDRGADALVKKKGTIGESLACELKAEARRRKSSNMFLENVSYVAMMAKKLNKKILIELFLLKIWG
jgi:arsenite methyltransferase